MIDVGHSLAIIAVTAAVTYLIRALAFLVFRHHRAALSALCHLQRQ